MQSNVNLVRPQSLVWTLAAIYRNGKPIRPLGTTIIEADDEVFFIAATIHIHAIMNELQKLEAPYKRIMIAGNIGVLSNTVFLRLATGEL